MRYWIDSKSSKHWLRTNPGRRSRFFGQIMVVSILPVGSLICEVRHGSRGSLQFLITHIKLEYQNGRIGPSFQQ